MPTGQSALCTSSTETLSSSDPRQCQALEQFFLCLSLWFADHTEVSLPELGPQCTTLPKDTEAMGPAKHQPELLNLLSL